MADGPGTTGAVGGSAQGHVVSPLKEGSDEKVRGEGLSHSAALEFNKTFEKGDVAHAAIQPSLAYVLGVNLAKNLFLQVTGGLGISSADRKYMTIGGQEIDSGFTDYHGKLGVGLRYHLPFLDRVYAEFGLTGKVGQFSTAESETVTIPAPGPSCTPGDFGRGTCPPEGEPAAGPRGFVSQYGTKGLMHFGKTAARGTEGTTLGLEFSLTPGVDILRGTWGSLALYLGPTLNVTKVSPDDGDKFSYTNWGLKTGLISRFGGADAYVSQGVTPRPDQDGDGVPDTEDACPKEAGIPNSDPKLNGCPAPAPASNVIPTTPIEASVTAVPPSVKPNEKFPIGIEVKSKSKLEVSVAFVGSDGKTTNSSSTHLVRTGKGDFPFDVPSSLKAGKYKLLITFEDPKSGVEKIEEKEVVIVESVTATLPGSFGPGQPPAVQNAKVSGIEKLEGVTYTVEGFDKDSKSVGTASGKNPITLNEKTGQLIKLDAPGKKGFEKDVTYKVSLKNKDGFELWSQSFVVGQAQTFTKKPKAK